MPIRRCIPVLLCLLLTGAIAAAQDSADSAQDSSGPTQTPSKSDTQEIQELRAELARVQADLAKAQASSAAQDSTAEQMKAILVSLNARLQQLEAKAPADSLSENLAKRVKKLEGRVSELPPSPDIVVTSDEFPGSVTVPGTKSAFKIGGRVRLSIIGNLDALNVDDRFLTAAIPAMDTPQASKGPRIELTANSSRLNFEMRTPTEHGQMRAFVEGDFAGDGNTFRLRHAYGQYRLSLAGQTWTTFTDPLAAPSDIDFEGVNARVNTRQPQVRITSSFWKDWTSSFAIESPQPEVTNAVGVSQVPDFIVAGNRKTHRWHAYLALLYRQIRAEPQAGLEDIKSKPGWGISLSGHAKLPIFDGEDQLRWQAVVGEGVGRYINDLEYLDDQDAVFDTLTQDLQVLPARGFYVNYEHQWSAKWSSSFVWGIVKVDNLGIQAPDSYRRTDRTSINLVYMPIDYLSIGLEFLHGARHNFDQSYGKANQIQFASTYRF